MTDAELSHAREEAERVVKNCRRWRRLRPPDRDYYEDMATDAQDQAEMVLRLLEEYFPQPEDSAERKAETK